MVVGWLLLIGLMLSNPVVVAVVVDMGVVVD